jgi:hypothetical protein
MRCSWTSSSCDSGRETACSYGASNAMDSRNESPDVKVLQQRHDWKKYADPIKEEEAEQGMSDRFGAGLPRISDRQLLFLQHMISKMRKDEQASRTGIVMNGSPLFTGGAGSSESVLRRWMLENAWVGVIIALPSDLFYNTGIQTYVWLLTNRIGTARWGKVQLIDANGERFWKSMRSLSAAKQPTLRPSSRWRTKKPVWRLENEPLRAIQVLSALGLRQDRVATTDCGRDGTVLFQGFGKYGGAQCFP